MTFYYIFVYNTHDWIYSTYFLIIPMCHKAFTLSFYSITPSNNAICIKGTFHGGIIIPS